VNKIPVGPTIASAYNFTFGHLGAIIGLIWLPMVLFAVVNFLPYALGVTQYDPTLGANEASRAAAINFACSIATFILYAMVYVAVTRQALGLRQGAASIHFALGAPEWRMLGALLLMAIVIGLLVVFYLIAASVAIGAASNMGGQKAAVAAMGVAVLAGVGALVYAILRFAFLLAPVVVAEEKISLTRAWTLSTGNFWRILLITLAIAAPVFLVESIAAYAIMGADLLASVPVKGDIMAILQATALVSQRHAPALTGLNLIMAPFSLGLNLGASAFAYRALAPSKSGVLA
jgi:hypothetical protein